MKKNNNSVLTLSQYNHLRSIHVSDGMNHATCHYDVFASEKDKWDVETDLLLYYPSLESIQRKTVSVQYKKNGLTLRFPVVA